MIQSLHSLKVNKEITNINEYRIIMIGCKNVMEKTKAKRSGKKSDFFKYMRRNLEILR